MGSHTQLPGSSLGTRQADGVLDHLGAPASTWTFFSYCPGARISLEQRAQLDLGPGAARLDVGEHALEVADAGGQALHLPEALLHGLELVADQLERLAEALLECGLELLVHRLAHLLELLLVARPAARARCASMVVRTRSRAAWLDALSSVRRLAMPSSWARWTSPMPLERDGQRVVAPPRGRARARRGTRARRAGLFAPGAQLVAHRRRRGRWAPRADRASRATSSAALTTASSRTSHRWNRSCPALQAASTWRPLRSGGPPR